MILESSDVRQSLRLVPRGYQYPPVSDPDADTWLVFAVEVRDPRGDWAFEDPCLTVLEAEQFATWLRHLAAHQVPLSPVGQDQRVRPTLLFTEPNLALSAGSAADGRVVVRVHFDYESAPPWAAAGSTSEQNWIELAMPPAEVVRAADDLLQEIAPFPNRPGPASSVRI